MCFWSKILTKQIGTTLSENEKSLSFRRTVCHGQNLNEVTKFSILCNLLELNPFKINNILKLSECRSHVKRNLCEEVKNLAMGDAESDMKKKMVRTKQIFETETCCSKCHYHHLSYDIVLNL